MPQQKLPKRLRTRVPELRSAENACDYYNRLETSPCFHPSSTAQPVVSVKGREHRDSLAQDAPHVRRTPTTKLEQRVQLAIALLSASIDEINSSTD